MLCFYGKSSNESVRPLQTPSPKPEQPPMNTSPLEPPLLRRSNAIRHVGEALVNCHREGVRAESSSTTGRIRPLSFTRTGGQDCINTGAGHVHNANKVIGDFDILPMKDEWMWEDMRRLPGILASFIKSGMPADELGFYLDKMLYGRDKSVGGIVTNLVNENVKYDEIAVRTLKLLDLYDGDGQLLSELIAPAESQSHFRPNLPLHYKVNHTQAVQMQAPPISPYARSKELLSYHDPNITGPETICPQPRHAVLELECIQRFVAEDANADATSSDDEDGEQPDPDPFADFDFAFDAPHNINANAYAGNAHDPSSSGSSPFDGGFAMQDAQAIQYINPGPARFYSQYYDGDNMAVQANTKQHNASGFPEKLLLGIAPKPEPKRERFLID